MKREVLNEKVNSKDLKPGEIYSDSIKEPVFLKFVEIKDYNTYFKELPGFDFYGKDLNGLVGFEGDDHVWYKTKILDK